MSEDTDEHAAEEARANRVTGWNGSRSLWRAPEPFKSVRPAGFAAWWASKRAELLAKAEQQRRRGLCL
jgi:hypothetical protein